MAAGTGGKIQRAGLSARPAHNFFPEPFGGVVWIFLPGISCALRCVGCGAHRPAMTAEIIVLPVVWVERSAADEPRERCDLAHVVPFERRVKREARRRTRVGMTSLLPCDCEPT